MVKWKNNGKIAPLKEKEMVFQAFKKEYFTYL